MSVFQLYAQKFTSNFLHIERIPRLTSLTKCNFNKFQDTPIVIGSAQHQERYHDRTFENEIVTPISYENRHDLVVENCKFVSCSSSQQDSTGGAILAKTAAHQSTDCTIVSSSFINCSAISGGACYLTTGPCQINQTCFINCTASRSGQALVLDFQESTKSSSLILLTVYMCAYDLNDKRPDSISLMRNKHSLNSLNSTYNNNNAEGVCLSCNAVKTLSIRLCAFMKNEGTTGFNFEQHDLQCDTTLVKTHIVNCTFQTAAFMSTSLGTVILNDCYLFRNELKAGKSSKNPQIQVKTKYEVISDNNFSAFFGPYASQFDNNLMFVITNRVDPVPWNALTPLSCVELSNESKSQTTIIYAIVISTAVIVVTGIICIIAFWKRKKSLISNWIHDDSDHHKFH